MKTFASVYIGSYEISLKIFELSAKKPMKEVEHIRSRIDLGRESFTDGILNYQTVDKLCEILLNFKGVMREYAVDDYEVYASAVIRDLTNQLLVLDQIYLRTGFQVEIVSNSEHRFITYKSVAGRKEFEQMITTSAAVVDIGGSSIQITIFRNKELITTQHLEIGTMRLRSQFENMGQSKKNYLSQMDEYINKKLEVLRSLYAKESIENVIFVNDYCTELVKKIDYDSKTDGLIKGEKLLKYLDKLQKKSIEEICMELRLSNAKDPLILPSISLFKGIIINLNCNVVWVSDSNFNDGIAYDYARRHELVKGTHDFETDIISASRNLAKHYQSHSPHIDALEEQALKIFDAMKKIHGMKGRERLLLEVAVILHDCGKYVSIVNSSYMAYQIIMSSEIIGLSHNEREIVGLTVLYNHVSLPQYETLADKISEESYITVAKLSAILRVANALDQSHKQKFKNTKVSLKDKELTILVESFEDISLEQALFETKTQYFENVFSIKPVLKEKRIYNYD